MKIHSPTIIVVLYSVLFMLLMMIHVREMNAQAIDVDDDDETLCDAAERVCKNNGISSMMELTPASLLFSNSSSSSMEMEVSPEYATITEMCATMCACGSKISSRSRAVTGAQAIISKRLVPASVAIEDYFSGGDDDEVYEMVVLLADDATDQQTQLVISVANVEFDGWSETLTFNATILESETTVFMDLPLENRRRRRHQNRRKLQQNERRRLLGNTGLTIVYDTESPACFFRS